jgi:pimeloyl-ACP methyl ester carboxylesterase
MLIKETEKTELPTIIILHGGGLSCWALIGIVELLQSDYHVVTPMIDGYGDDFANDFISIEDSAKKLTSYIEQQCNGKVYALCGLSIGAQIVVEAMTQKTDIAEFAVLESALVLPVKGTKTLVLPTIKLFYGLIKMKWFARLQAKTLYVPEALFELYFNDSIRISKQSLINTILSNGTYTLKDNIEKTNAKVLIIAGEKEINLIKKSAKLLSIKIPNNELSILESMGHGELSMAHPVEYVRMIKEFFAK